MPLFKFHEKLVFFVHIPKTGGTSIATMLARVGKQALRGPGNVDWWQCTPQHAHAAVYKNMGLPGFADYAFTLIRHPLARAISEYKMAAARTKVAGRPVPTVSEWFLNAKQLAKQNPYVADNHMRRQREFLAPGIDVYRFEDGVDVIMRIVSEKLDLGLQDFNVHARPGWTGPVKVSRHTLERIAWYYRHDFEGLGYDKDIDLFVAGSNGAVVLSDEDTISAKSRLLFLGRKGRFKLRALAERALMD